MMQFPKLRTDGLASHLQGLQNQWKAVTRNQIKDGV